MQRWYSNSNTVKASALASPAPKQEDDVVNHNLSSTEDREHEELFQNLTPRDESGDSFAQSMMERDQQLMSLSKKFIKYRLNIFLLNKAALRIQHWFFVGRLKRKQVLAQTALPLKRQLTSGLRKPTQTKIPRIVSQTKPSAIKVEMTSPFAKKEGKSPIITQGSSEKEQAKQLASEVRDKEGANVEEKKQTLKKSASLANHHAKLETTKHVPHKPFVPPPVVANNGRTSVRQSAAAVLGDNHTSKKSEQSSGIPTAKRATMHERPQSSKASEHVAQNSTKLQIDSTSSNRKLGEKKASVEGQNLKQIAKAITATTPMATGQTSTRPSRNSFKNVGLSGQQSTVNNHTSSTQAAAIIDQYKTVSSIPNHTPASQPSGIPSMSKIASKSKLTAAPVRPQSQQAGANFEPSRPMISHRASYASILQTSTTTIIDTKTITQPAPVSARGTSQEENPLVMQHIISDAWKKAEEIKKERIKRASVCKTHNQSRDSVADLGEDEQAIINAAWVQQRDKVFKKKRNSIVANKTSQRTSDQCLHTQSNLEEIDEKEESMRIQIEEVDSTPLKLRQIGENHNVNSALRSSRETFRSSFIDAHMLLSHRDMDETSSQMCSNAGSPFRKARRTREERRKTTVDGHGSSTNDGENVNILNDENTMLNISPLRKPLKLKTSPNQAEHQPFEIRLNEGSEKVPLQEHSQCSSNIIIESAN